MAKRLPFPVNISGETIGSINVDEVRLASILGVQHKTCGPGPEYPGPVSLWAFELDDGMKVVVEYYQTKRFADIACSPPNLDAALAGLGLDPSLVYWRRDSTEP